MIEPPVCAFQPEGSLACEVMQACTAGLPSDAEVERALLAVAIALDGPHDTSTLDAMLEPDEAKAPRPPAKPRKLLMTAGALATAHAGGSTVGPRALAAYRVDPGYLTFGLAGTMTPNDDVRRVRAGLGVATLAPFSADFVGLAFETGIEHQQRYRSTEVLAYLQGSVILQVPLESVRPYLALSAGIVSANPSEMGGVETGIVFPVF
jgi:hypothetical protein